MKKMIVSMCEKLFIKHNNEDSCTHQHKTTYRWGRGRRIPTHIVHALHRVAALLIRVSIFLSVFSTTIVIFPITCTDRAETCWAKTLIRAVIPASVMDATTLVDIIAVVFFVAAVVSLLVIFTLSYELTVTLR